MASPPPLSHISDPTALGKLQILLVPVHGTAGRNQTIPDALYVHWTDIVKRTQSVRSDELIRPDAEPGHSRGGSTSPRTRFFPASSATSVSRANTTQHVHISYPAHPAAKHLYPLSLLRMTAFPLVVIGVGVAPGEQEEARGFAVDEGDIGEASTPRASRIQVAPVEDPILAMDDTLNNLLPPSSAYPLVKRLILVPSSAPASSPAHMSRRPAADKGKAKETGDVRFAPTEGAEPWVGRLIAETVGDLLGELGELATALETPTGLKTLSSTLLPSLTATLPTSFDYTPRSPTPTDPPRSGTPTSNSATLDALNGIGPMGITLKRALTPGGRPTSVQAKLPPINTSISPEPRPMSSNPFRRSTAISSPFSRASSAASISSNSSGGPQSPIVAQRYTTASLSGVAGGRLMKLLGDFHLLTGQFADAIKCYDDGAERCRVTGDVLWEGVAREGRAVAGIGEAWETRDGSDRVQSFSSSPIPAEILAHYLSALSCISKAPLPYPPTILSPAPQAISGSLTLPAPSAPSLHMGTGEGLLAYLYTSLCLRIAHYQLIVWAAGGWGSIAQSALMAHYLPRTFPLPVEKSDAYARRRRHRFLALLSSRSGLTRSSIFHHAEGAIGPQHRGMTRPEQLAVHVELVWLARWLDLPRHEAMVAREAVRKIGAMIVEGREETRRHAKAGFGKSGRAGGASVGLGLGMSVKGPSVAVRRKESTDGNEAVVKLIEGICGAVGVQLLSPFFEEEAPPVNELQAFGWPEIQVESLQSAITVVEGLADHAAVARLSLSALRYLTPYLSAHSQIHLCKLAPAALGVLKRRGRWDGQDGVGWWVPGKFVLSLEVASLSASRLPVAHAASEIAKGEKDLFLHNPRIKVAEAGKTLIVANEQVDVFVTLSNPFAFDLEVADLALITSGADFVTNPLPLHLPATSIQTIRITGYCPSAGALSIKGVTARLPDGARAEFYLPILDAKAKERKSKRRSRALGESGKMKHSGMDGMAPQVDANENTDKLGEGESWMECIVVEEQPLLWVRKSSLTHGTLMLYDGEKTTLRLTLENSSTTPVNFIKLAFADNTVREAQALLGEELGPRDAYEIQHDQLFRPVMRWEEREVLVKPGGRTVLEVECLGKVGCTDGSIRIDYGNVSTGGAFYTRNITFPVLFTVYHTLDAHDLDIYRFPPSSAPITNAAGASRSKANGTRPDAARPALTPRSSSFAHASIRHDRLKAAMEDEADDAHCLVALSVRNGYGVPFEVCLSREGDDVAATRLIPPGSTERLLLPLPRISLLASALAEPIPTLGSRQYVVDKSGKTAADIRRECELFWTRDALLRMISLTYLEPGARREGEVNLRRVGVERKVVDVLRKDDVELDLALQSDGADWGVGDFVRLALDVRNRLEHDVAPYVRIDAVPTTSAPPLGRHSLAPPPLHAVKHVIFDGTMSSAMSTIAPGAGGRHELDVAFLAEGSFAFRAVVEVQMEGQESKVWFSDTLRVEVRGPGDD